MTQDQQPFQNRRAFLLASSAGMLSLQWSCASQTNESVLKPKEIAKAFKMGERAAVGFLTYNVLESTYFTQLGAEGKQKMAQKRFLVLRMSITNGGAKEIDIPLFNLVDDKGNTFPELQEADFLQGWYGLIRKVGPTTTEEGRILFDVDPKPYKLQVTDGGETGSEQFGYIEIPMEFDTSEPIPAAGQGVPSVPSKK